MDSDESGHSESEFYYPQEETFNQITPINRDEVEQDRQLSNIQDFIYSLRPDNTKKKTTYDLNIWRRFCSTVGETRALEKIPSEELNILLCRFFRRTPAQDVFGFEQRKEQISHLLKQCTSWQTSSQTLGARAAIQRAKKASFFGRRARLLWHFHWFKHQRHWGMHI